MLTIYKDGRRKDELRKPPSFPASPMRHQVLPTPPPSPQKSRQRKEEPGTPTPRKPRQRKEEPGTPTPTPRKPRQRKEEPGSPTPRKPREQKDITKTTPTRKTKGAEPKATRVGSKKVKAEDRISKLKSPYDRGEQPRGSRTVKKKVTMSITVNEVVWVSSIQFLDFISSRLSQD
jgi:hypothetical protein